MREEGAGRRRPTPMRRLLMGNLPALVLISVALISGRPTSVTAQAGLPGVPPETPDASIGLDLFAERCAVCHGPLGAGDGEMAPDLPVPPASFAAPGFMDAAVPSDLFQTITNGRLENGMPPFGPASSNALSETERWHLVAALYSLGTPIENLDLGQATLAENDLSLDRLATLPPATDPAWFAHSNTELAAALETELAPLELALSPEALRAVVSLGRSATYRYVDVLASLRPIEQAVISGEVRNGTTGETIGEGIVTLSGFTPDIQPALVLTTSVGTDGRYHFDLSQVLPQWIYLTDLTYGGIDFNSTLAQLSATEPEVELPLFVFEQTTDPAVVQVEQLNLHLRFVEDRVQIDEVYVFSNQEPAVFVGSGGRPEQGTVEIALPTGAQNVAFRRIFGTADSSIPANEMIRTDMGWADTLPLRPGSGSLNLLVRYELPYRDGMVVAHPLRYPTVFADLILPDAGVSLGEGEWSPQEAQAALGGSFQTYRHPSIAASQALSFELKGRPRLVNDASGNRLLIRSETTELGIGAAGLVAALLCAGYLVWTWRRPADETETDLQDLLRAVARLDDRFARGKISKKRYQRRRSQLKQELLTRWPDGKRRTPARNR